MGVKIVEASSVNAGDSETLDTKVMEFAEQCLAKVKAEGAPAVYAYAGQFGELTEGQSAVAFALAQKASFVDMETPIPGGVAGHTVSPVEVAGCYAPGGRYPLPSSVLMTAVTARAAGVKTVVVATPKPLPVTLAAAHVAGADVLVAVGGAHAIAAMATGARRKACSGVLCGPGAWVTAAKACAATSARVGIDMIAGPSEVLVICDETADAATAGALKMVAKINAALDAQLENLPTKAVAAPACARGYAVACESVDEALRVSDAVAPEHLEVICENERAVADRCNHYGGLFVGSRSAEVMGDYGIGPNHTLGCAVRDAVRLARIEGLEGHARAAEARLLPPPAKKQKV
ncbi:histidinol dehydrogenase [Aureococcus anophagefferens]|nr:histidinol dehydrogenase [Aureococcus anophagefferens]